MALHLPFSSISRNSASIADSPAATPSSSCPDMDNRSSSVIKLREIWQYPSVAANCSAAIL